MAKQKHMPAFAEKATDNDLQFVHVVILFRIKVRNLEIFGNSIQTTIMFIEVVFHFQSKP